MYKIFVLLVYISVSTVYANFDVEENELLHLSDQVEPSFYNLKITPDLSTSTFSGKIDIDTRVKISTNAIKLHCKNLNITKNRLYEKTMPNTLISIQLRSTGDFCEITSSQTLNPGSIYVLSVEFKGQLKENGKGLYKISYETNRVKKWLVATNFYGNHAREVFPCFDEPRFRTPFLISVARKSDQKVISNMILDKPLPHSDKLLTWDLFKTTPPLSTNQVGFVVTEFSFTPETENLIKIWTRPNMIVNVQYALKQSDKILKQLENYLSIPYKVSKFDFVVTSGETPRQTPVENWGLSLFTESQLISDDKKISEVQRKIVTNSICRQLARHWFGGQVMPVSMDYSWLTEAFAGYMELVATTLAEPTWKPEAIFTVQVLQPALRGEIYNAQTLTSSIKTRSQINDNYELINQLKGASIIRMLEHMTPKNSLRSVIHNYLINSQKQNNGFVTPENLYKELQHQSEIDSFPLPPHFSVVDVMKTWTENKGYPLLTVTRDYENGTIEIEQRTFRPREVHTSSDDQNWITPISYTTKSEALFQKTIPSTWIYTNKTTLSAEVESSDWIILNLQQTNYYRVNYDTQNWNFLIKQLEENFMKIHVLNRAQLIDDAFTLAFENKLGYEIPMKLVNYLRNENEIVPVLSAMFHLNKLNTKCEDTLIHPYIEGYIQEILEKPVQSFGFKINPSDDHLVKLGKPSVLSLACKARLTSCTQAALGEFKSNIGDLSKVQPDLKEVVFCTALREIEKSNDQIYEKLMSLYRTSNIVYEKISILKTLGCTRDENVLKKILSKLFQKKEFSKFDEDYVYDSILSSSNGITTALKFIQERIREMKNDEPEVLKKLMYKLEQKVQATKHTRMLENLLAESDKLGENYNIFKESLQRAHSLSSERVKENNKNSAILKPIVYDLLNAPSVYNPPKNDSPSNFATASFGMLFLGLYLVYMYQFYHLL